MHLECRERFPHNWLHRKPLVSDPSTHHGTFVTHVPWCMSGSLTHDARENIPGIPGACAHRNFTYLARGPWSYVSFTLGHRYEVSVATRYRNQFIIHFIGTYMFHFGQEKLSTKSATLTILVLILSTFQHYKRSRHFICVSCIFLHTAPRQNLAMHFFIWPCLFFFIVTCVFTFYHYLSWIRKIWWCWFNLWYEMPFGIHSTDDTYGSQEVTGWKPSIQIVFIWSPFRRRHFQVHFIEWKCMNYN